MTNVGEHLKRAAEAATRAAAAANVGAQAAPQPKRNNWPEETPEALRAFYGEPGDKSNLVRVKTPYPIYYGSQSVSSVRLHHKVADSFVRVMKAVLDHYGNEAIKELGLDQYDGSYNNRNIRGGQRKSTHAWGIALDFDAKNNRLHTHKPDARLSGPEYNAWWRCWEAEGWQSLGRLRDFDWMHVQACYRK